MMDPLKLYFFVRYPQLREKLISFAADLGYDICDGYAHPLTTITSGIAFVDSGVAPELVVRLAQKIPVVGFVEQQEILAWPLKKRLDPHCDFETFKQHFAADFPSQIKKLSTADDELLGYNALWEEVKNKAHKAAATDCFVLLQGESGTGKEIVARFIHRLSQRASKPFIAINCAAIPHDLIESELFGYEKGAFTGAVQNKTGKFEAAADGTLFLDEIGDMPPLMQVKLLRVLQEREFERLGSHQLRPFKARVICATHRCLKEMVQKKEFRADLYYRLNVLPLTLPPLRERLDDLEPLIEHIVQKEGMTISLTQEALNLMKTYSWPGNIRELFNILARADVFFANKILTVSQVKSLFDDEIGSY